MACKGNLVGIVSYGTAICAVGLPDVYTRASSFVDWVKENTGETESGSTIPAENSTSPPSE